MGFLSLAFTFTFICKSSETTLSNLLQAIIYFYYEFQLYLFIIHFLIYFIILKLIDHFSYQIKNYTMTDANSDLHIYLITETSICLIINALFLVYYVRRINKLDKMASNNFHSKPKLMKFKIILVTLIMFLVTAHIALAFTDKYYWLYNFQVYSLGNIVEIINCLLQIYIIRKQHKKMAIRTSTLPALWFVWLSLDTATIIFVEIQTPNISILLLIFKDMAQVILVVIGCFMQVKDQENLQALNGNSTGSPLITEIRKNSQRNSDTVTQFDNNKLYIEFNKQFNIIQRNQYVECQFKFAVFVGQQSHIITKKQEDFLLLQKQMIESFPQNSEVILKDHKKINMTNMMRYGQEKQKIYQAYLIDLTKTQKYYNSCLFDFLQINQLKRSRLVNKRQKTNYIKKDSFNGEDQEVLKKPFFEVHQKNNKIYISNPDILQLILNKSHKEIQKFHQKLLQEKRLKMQLLTEQPDETQYKHFIFRVVNNKYLWRCFSQWMALGRQIEDKIYKMFDFWNLGFKNIKMNIIGHQIVFDKEGSIHTLYLISVTQKHNESMVESNFESTLKLIKNDGITLKKRFSDFTKLDKNIRKFMHQNHSKGQLMSLPPKFSPFGTKTSPKSRQIYLDMYINQVRKLQGINHCIKFLQFLQIDTGSIKKQEFSPIDQQNFAVSFVSSMIIDDIDKNI